MPSLKKKEDLKSPVFLHLNEVENNKLKASRKKELIQ